MTSQADAELTDDRLLGGRIRFQQPRRGYRVAIDPVLLAASVAVADDGRVLDAGTGTAAAALCLASRLTACHVTGLERDPELLAIGRRNVAGNALIDRVELLEGDLLDPPADLRATSFDVVMSNPPYHPAAAACAPATPTRRAAHLASADLSAWVAACLARLRPLGRLFLIHPPGRLDAILGALAGIAGDVVVLPLWPRVDAPAAKRVIVAARKGGRSPLRLARGLVLHEPDGRYTPATEAILRDGAPLPL
jgi:tRNA1(Val) A37 N6-methylase TrmN6